MFNSRLGYFASLLLVVSFIGLAVFSFAIFNHGLNHSAGSCLAYTINGAACPTNIIKFVMHHVAVLQIFSRTLISSILVLFFALALFLFLVPFFVLWLFQNWPFSKLNTSYSQRKFVRWLALLEHSPSA